MKASRRREDSLDSASAGSSGDVLLRVSDLSVRYETPAGRIPAAQELSFEISRGETLGLIGESGCGKSTTALALLGLAGPASRIAGGRVLWKGGDLLRLSSRELRRIRGNGIGIAFQDPQSALHPALPILDQVEEAIRVHRADLGEGERRESALGALERAGIPRSVGRRPAYPHEWSGGMRQRAVLAMAMANEPELLIADEPTTALDVTVQAQIVELLRSEIRSRGTAMLLITHDLGVVAELADRVAVMYAGRIVETGGVEEIFASPRHPYTLGLLASRPGLEARGAENAAWRRLEGAPPDLLRLPSGCPFHPRCARSGGRELCRDRRPSLEPVAEEGRRAACHFHDEAPGPIPVPEREASREPDGADPIAGVGRRRGSSDLPPPPHRSGEGLLSAEGLTTVYRDAGDGRGTDGGVIRAIRNVSLRIGPGEILGLVGESGCGKSTLARTLVGLERPSAGRVLLGGRPIVDAERDFRPGRGIRRQIQIVFQDPYASLNPRRTAGEAVAQALRVHGVFRAAGGWERVHELLGTVGLSREDAERFPHELSGGERQRVGIARAIAVEPRVLVLDEPVTALDVAVRAQILDLLDRLRRELEISCLLIAHDLSMVRELAHRIAVMYLGRIVEVGAADDLFHHPTHPYTRALLSAVPASDPRDRRLGDRVVLEGEVPDPAEPPSGCAFHTRCWKARDRCRELRPPLERRGDGGSSACFFPE